jgi:hypothetical protein
MRLSVADLWSEMTAENRYACTHAVQLALLRAWHCAHHSCAAAGGTTLGSYTSHLANVQCDDATQL